MWCLWWFDIKTALGIEQDEVQIITSDEAGAALSADSDDTSSLFAPIPGVFDPDKRFYADAGEFRRHKVPRRTRYLQLTAQLVGHDEEFMGKVETDVPAIRNGLSIFLPNRISVLCRP